MKRFTALQNAREKSGKTQVQVATETKMDVRVYQNYEYGVNRRAIQNAIRIARSVGSTVEEIWNTDFQNNYNTNKYACVNYT